MKFEELDDKLEPSAEIRLMAESLGFGSGYERTYKAYAVYVVKTDGTVYISSPRTDRYFKKRRFAEDEAFRINLGFGTRYDHTLKEYILVENPGAWAFVKEIEVTERIS